MGFINIFVQAYTFSNKSKIMTHIFSLLEKLIDIKCMSDADGYDQLVQNEVRNRL